MRRLIPRGGGGSFGCRFRSRQFRATCSCQSSSWLGSRLTCSGIDRSPGAHELAGCWCWRGSSASSLMSAPGLYVRSPKAVVCWAPYDAAVTAPPGPSSIRVTCSTMSTCEPTPFCNLRHVSPFTPSSASEKACHSCSVIPARVRRPS